MKSRTLLVAGALTLASPNLMAYQIVESHFHVEVAPDKYVDQLVLRCEDGRQITVPWQSKLAEACGEDLMGNVTRPSKAAPPQPAQVDEQQKQAMLEQLRAQYGNISESQVEFISGPTGVSTRFKAPIVEVLKKYESCRKALKDKSYCAGERDKALAKLADSKPNTTARAPDPVENSSRDAAVAAPAPAEVAAQAPVPTVPIQQAASPAPTTPQPAKAQTTAPAEPTSRAKTPPAKAQAAAGPAEAPARVSAPLAAQQPSPPVTQPAGAPTATAEAAPQAATSPPATDTQVAPLSEAELRAATEQKINQDYMACMRAKPKFDCDQARTKAVAALDKPKAVKQRKPSTTAAAPQTQR